MKNKLFSVSVEDENREGREHRFFVSLEFCDPIRERDALHWLQRVIADAARKEFEVANN